MERPPFFGEAPFLWRGSLSLGRHPFFGEVSFSLERSFFEEFLSLGRVPSVLGEGSFCFLGGFLLFLWGGSFCGRSSSVGGREVLLLWEEVLLWGSFFFSEVFVWRFFLRGFF